MRDAAYGTVHTMVHLWEMETLWFGKPDNEAIHTTFPYKSWKDFQECKPYKLWKPYILSSWSWKKIPLDSYRHPKRRDVERHFMDCTAILRMKPSQYDKDPVLEDETRQEVEMLQIVFLSPDRFRGVHRVEVIVTKENEEDVRAWIKDHMPTFWKLD